MTNSEARRKELYALLGDVPPRDHPIAVIQTTQDDRPAYRLEKLVLDLNGLEPVPAYFLYPHDQPGPYPTVLYNHSHGGLYTRGKEELLQGREYLQTPPYANVLTQQGYAVLCIDAWGFGGRSGRTESSIFKEMLWNGRVMWGMMVYDSLRAMDYLFTRPEVDTRRVATLGMSMGSNMAQWVAALDERIKVCVDICCLTDYQSLIDSKGLDGHGIYYYVPSLLKHFTTAEINTLIVPRPHLGLAGNLDPLTPFAGLDKIDAALKDAYRSAGAADAWKMFRCDVQHFEAPEMRTEAIAFLKRWL
jgi:dienelactone hydrolase